MGRGPQPTKVLLVEDDVLISAIVADELRDYGFDVLEAGTGEEAISWLEGEPEIALLFTDVNLPGNVDGRDLAVRARAMRPELPIVYASGRYAAFGLDGMVTRSLFVPKPYRPAEVCALLARLTEPSH
ncbi:MAG TPA: response regulator [Pseudolabrys sp.]|nr:response regulator [Pseudolabrys sp.]